MKNQIRQKLRPRGLGKYGPKLENERFLSGRRARATTETAQGIEHAIMVLARDAHVLCMYVLLTGTLWSELPCSSTVMHRVVVEGS